VNMHRLFRVGSLVGAAIVTLQSPNAKAADIEAIANRVCAPQSNGSTTDYQNRLFGFILSDAGFDVPVNERKQTIADAYDASENGQATKAQKLVVDLIKTFQRQLSLGKAKPVFPSENLGGRNQLGRWLIDERIALECRSEPSDEGSESKLRLRKDSASLKLTGDDRQEAGAATVSFKSERTLQADGSSKRDTTFNLKGVLGYALSESDNKSAFAYVGYELNRVRTKPAPILVAPATERDGDTELLKVGFFGHTAFGEKLNWVTSVDTAYLFDIAKKSERMRASVALVPALPFDNLGICGVGALNSTRKTLIKGVQGKCTFTGLFEVNHIFKAGSADFGAKDEFVQVGGKATIDLLLSGKFESGFFAGAEYRYLDTVHGGAPAIDRFTGHLKYRHWLNDVGFDVGLELVDGTNPDSFVDENIIQLAFGIIF
jgi:hypothetical protein